MSGNNSSVIFITEKPSVAQEYRKVLKVQSGEKTNGYIEGHSPVMNTNVIITWAVGHLIEICSPEEHNENWKAWTKESLPMFPSPFRYKPQNDTFDQFKVVKSLYTRKDIDCIYYAGDSAREGIYIQALIRNQIFKTAPKFSEKVVWIDSYTEESILNGIRDAKPYADYAPMIDAGYARARADWLIGMNLSRAFTLTSGGYGNSIAVGRVMTPTLAIIVNRQREIENFVKKYYYGVRADNLTWRAVKGSRFFESDELYSDKAFLHREDAEKLCKELSGDMTLTVEGTEVKKKTEYAPFPFDQISLPAYCKRFRMSPAHTLDVAQKLYEKKYITYPRTDYCYLTKAVQQDMKRKFGFDIPNRYVDDSKVGDHPAITPTFEGNPNSLSEEERKVYDAIYKRFMDLMKPPMIADKVTVAYLHSSGERFFDSFQNIRQKGFKEDELTEEDMQQTPIPQKGTKITVTEYAVADMESKPPAPYNEADLPAVMKKAGQQIDDEELRNQIKSCGLGTAATRAGIIEKLKRGYITVDKKGKVAPTEKGVQVIQVVEKYDKTLASPVKTAEYEQKLQAIGDAEFPASQFDDEIISYLKATVRDIFEHNTDHIAGAEGKGGAVSGKCPHCGGEVTKGKFGWYCKSKCGMNISKVYGHELTDAQIGKLLSGKEITYTTNGRKTTVLPEAVQNDWQGKTYWNWKTKSGGAAKTSNSSKKTSSVPSKPKASGWGGGTWGKK